MPIVIVAAVMLPLLFRAPILGLPAIADARQIIGTATGVTVSIIAAFLISEEALKFPGRMLIGYVLATFTVSFLIVVALFFMFRFDYSRFQFLGGYIISAGWMVFYYWQVHTRSRTVLGLVPAGDALTPAQIDKVDWVPISEPTDVPPGCQGVVADLHADLPDRWARFITSCVLAGVPVYHTKHIVEVMTGKLEIRHLSENTLGSLNPRDVYLRFKYFVDATIAALFLIVLAPLLLVVALAIRLDSPGPALFRQVRVGFRGERFRIFKFRTMTHLPEAPKSGEARAASMTAQGDQRITRLGAFLRKSRIDELPQMINILRGEMSWIGPRPEAVALSEWYESTLPFYSYRHIVRPGISGWAQVNQGHVVELDEVQEKLHYDFFYIRHFSPWLDLLICLMTVEVMIRGYGAR
ncbi:MAG: sugar transferase [Rhodoblastus sp.]